MNAIKFSMTRFFCDTSFPDSLYSNISMFSGQNVSPCTNTLQDFTYINIMKLNVDTGIVRDKMGVMFRLTD